MYELNIYVLLILGMSLWTYTHQLLLQSIWLTGRSCLSSQLYQGSRTGCSILSGLYIHSFIKKRLGSTEFWHQQSGILLSVYLKNVLLYQNFGNRKLGVTTSLYHILFYTSQKHIIPIHDLFLTVWWSSSSQHFQSSADVDRPRQQRLSCWPTGNDNKFLYSFSPFLHC